MTKKIKINLVGDAFAQTGYGHHIRNYASALIKVADVTLESGVPQQQAFKIDNDLYKAVTGKRHVDGIQIAVTQPHSWRLMYTDRLDSEMFIGFLVWEGDRIPSGWLEYCNDDFVDAIFVPSTHVKLAAEKSGVTKPIFVIGEGVDHSKFGPEMGQIDQLKSDKLTFLFNKGWAQRERDRSGANELVEAWKKTFKREDPVRLILKINPVYGTTQDDISSLGLYDGMAETTIISDFMDDKTMAALYNTCDVFVNPAKAEGYGLPVAEAMASGKPVIAVNFGGHTDFLTKDEGWLLEPDGFEPATDGNRLYEETKWAKIDVDKLSKLLRGVSNNKDLITKKGQNALKKSKSLSWDAAAEKTLAAIKKIKKK